VTTIALADEPIRWEWKYPFEILAVRRCEPLWPEVGLPDAVLRHAQRVRQIALDFCDDFIAAMSDGFGRPADRAARAAVDRAIEQVGALIDRGTSADLREWLVRFDLGPQRRLWPSWQMVIARLAAPKGTGVELETFGLGPELSNRLIAEARQRYGKDSRSLDLAVQAARAIPLSARESGLLTIDAASRGPEDEELFDIVLHAEVKALDYRAWTFWRDVLLQLSEREIDQFMSWARAQAQARHMSTEDLVRPRL
jgi:hypothetical protein